MRKIRSRIRKPAKMWDAERIAAERKLMNGYGLGRKKELWRAETIVSGFRHQARELAATKDEGRSSILFDKLSKLGILSERDLDGVLALKVENVLDRRLQTVVSRKGLAKTPKQARQLIVHGHVTINDRKVTAPSYLVPVGEEAAIALRNAKGVAV